MAVGVEGFGSWDRIDGIDRVDGRGCMPLVAVEEVEEQGLGDGHEVVVCDSKAAEVLDGFEVHGRRGDEGATGWMNGWLDL